MKYFIWSNSKLISIENVIDFSPKFITRFVLFFGKENYFILLNADKN